MDRVSQLRLRAFSLLSEFYTTQDLNNRLSDLRANDLVLLNAVNDAKIGQANFAFAVPIADNVAVGQPVYFNTNTERFELSALATIRSGGRLYASPSSEAIGLVHALCGGGRANLLLDGMAEVNLTASVGQSMPSGKFYLSPSAGKLDIRPNDAIVAPTLFALGSGEVLFRPWFADTFPRYVPHRRDLTTAPAGDLVTASGQVTITNPSVLLAGWLPAGHVSFGGNQPAGAAFGYNRQADSVLSVAWPPLEPELCKVYYEAGGNTSQGARVMLADESGRLRVDQYGIWWMGNCVGQAPWDYAPSGATGQTTCPKSVPRRMVLEATFGTGETDQNSLVTRLRSRIPWLQFGRDGRLGNYDTGNLELLLDPTKLIGEAFDIAPVALKRLVDGSFTAGPVVTSIRSTSPSLQVSGTQVEGLAGKVGLVQLSVTTSMDFDLLPVETQLFGVTTEAYGDTISLGLPNGRNANFVSSFHVPSRVPDGSSMRFVLWLLAPANMVLPAGLTAKIRRFTDPSAPTAVPAEVVLPVNYTVGQTLQADNYIEITTDLVEVSGADTIYLRVSRAGATDGVSTELRVLKHFARFDINNA